MTNLPLKPSFLAVLVCMVGAAACGGGGDGGPIGGGTWPVPDLAGLTAAPSVSAETAALAAPAGGAVAGSTVKITNDRTRETTSSVASDTGALVGSLDSRPGDVLAIRLNYDGKDTEPAEITLPVATDSITLTNVQVRHNRDGGQTGASGKFQTTLGHRPTIRAFTKAGIARVSDSPLDGDATMFLVLLEAAVGETVIVHAFDGDDPSVTTDYVEYVVTQ